MPYKGSSREIPWSFCQVGTQRERGPKGAPHLTTLHPDLGLPASTTVRNKGIIYKRSSVYYFVMAPNGLRQLDTARTGSVNTTPPKTRKEK